MVNEGPPNLGPVSRCPGKPDVSGVPIVAVTWSPTFPVAMDVVERELDGVARIEPVKVEGGGLGAEALVEALVPARAVIMRPGQLSADSLGRLSSLRHVAVHGAGVERVDVDAATRLGILVTNAAGANAVSVAELTMALAVALLRGFVRGDAEIRAGRWAAARVTGSELAGHRLGIIGVGHVGSRVAARARAFEMDVIGCDPAYSNEELATRGVRALPFEDVVATADLVTLHVPLDTTTHHLFDASVLARMRHGAYLLNLCRGGVVDEAALVVALREGRLAGAALDVREVEPPTTADEMAALDCVIQTPHIGGSTIDATRRMAQMCARDVAAVLMGQPPTSPVNVV